MRIYLDTETLPDLSVHADDRLVQSPPPSNYRKQEAIDRWHERNPPSDAGWRRGSLQRFELRVLAVGWAVDREEPRTLLADYRDGMTPAELDRAEETLLRAWADLLARDGALDVQSQPDWITWNGNGFDLPLLAVRAVKYGLIDLGRALPSRKFADKSIDVAEVMRMTDYRGQIPSMRDVAAYFGTLVDDEIDGSGVFDAWRDGRLDLVRRHCRADVDLLRSIHESLIAGGVLWR